MEIKNVLKFKVLDITYIFQCDRKKIEEIMSKIEFAEKTNDWD